MCLVHVDMNLLAALDALLEERSVSGAAARLHLSQPAMSRTLGRIRSATGDPILVRAGRSMVPSPRARALRAEVSELVRRARAVLAPEGDLVPAELERTFTIRCHDALLAGLGPALIEQLCEQAPGVTVRFLGETAGDLDDPRHGRVDLDIGSARAASATRHEEVARDELAVALRRDHPQARRTLTVERFAGAHHVLVSRRGRLRDRIDDALGALGLGRRVVAAAPTSAAALGFVRDTDLMTTVAARTCRPLARTLGLVLRPLPLPIAAVPIIQSWPEHVDGDRAHQWLRNLTRSLLDRLARG